jgi:hypothetical protein
VALAAGDQGEAPQHAAEDSSGGRRSQPSGPSSSARTTKRSGAGPIQLKG